MKWAKALLKKQGIETPHKMGAKRVRAELGTDGYSFASKGEAALYQQLKLEQRAGDIEILQVQCQVLLSEAAIIYRPDFKIFDRQKQRDVYIEFKGYETPEWRIKRRLWIAYGPGPLRVYRQAGDRIYLHEEIEGKA